MVKSDRQEDMERVLHGGPWMISDHCVVVAQWSPNFISPTSSTLKSLVWLRFLGLNQVFYEENFLMALTVAIDKPIKVDRCTLHLYRGRYACVCVELDFCKPTVTKVWFREELIDVQYEGFLAICKHCGCIGHLGVTVCRRRPHRKSHRKEKLRQTLVTPKGRCWKDIYHSTLKFFKIQL